MGKILKMKDWLSINENESSSEAEEYSETISGAEMSEYIAFRTALLAAIERDYSEREFRVDLTYVPSEIAKLIGKSKVRYSYEDVIFLSEKCTGGADGGNCWGGEPRAFGSKEEEVLTSIDAIFKFLNIDSYSFYKEFQTAIKTVDICESEHYGNYSDYEVKYILVWDIFKLWKKKQS